MSDWQDDPIAAAGVAMAHILIGMDLPKGTRLRGTKAGMEITEPDKEPYFLTTPKPPETQGS